jgi:uncharacterized protein
MSISLHRASVPVFTQALGGLRGILQTANEHMVSRNIEPAALLQARLFPDMFALTRQVHIACDFARGVCARLAGAEVPAAAGTEQDFPALIGLIDATLAFIGALPSSAFEGAESREIVLRPGTPKERRFNGVDYLLSYGLPQFFFHVTTSYALLRHNGVVIGKKDYMGNY